MSEEFEKLKRDVARKRKSIDKHQTELQALLSTCPHEETVPESYHFEGSYTNKAYTDSWDTCKLCGLKFNKRTEQHDWFG
jgi:hypothetical protein